MRNPNEKEIVGRKIRHSQGRKGEKGEKRRREITQKRSRKENGERKINS